MRRGIAIAALMCCSPVIADPLPPDFEWKHQDALVRMTQGDLEPMIRHLEGVRDYHLDMSRQTFDPTLFAVARREKGQPIPAELVRKVEQEVSAHTARHRALAAEASWKLHEWATSLRDTQAAQRHLQDAQKLAPQIAQQPAPEVVQPPLPPEPPQPQPSPQEPAPVIPTQTPADIFDTGKTMAADWLTSLRTDEPPYMPWGIAAALIGIIVGVIDNAALKRRKWVKSVTFYGVLFGFVGMLAQTIYTYA